MKRILFAFMFVLLASNCFADFDVIVLRQKSSGKVLQMISRSVQGAMTKSFVEIGYDAGDLEEVVMPYAQYQAIFEAQHPYAGTVAEARAKKMTEIRAKATTLTAQFPTLFWNQGADYQSALSDTIATAAYELDALSDIAAIKNYQPSWPSTPLH